VLVQDLPDDVIVYTLPSRYCQSDLFLQDAWTLFGHVQGGGAQVQAVCDWLHAQITYAPGSTSSTSALEAYRVRTAVCRDFAHMAISFCRALSIPARYISGYLPEIGVPPDGLPMDFHAWFQAYLGGAWWTFDARHNSPRTGRIVIAMGRDAADVAFSTIYGATQLVSLQVWADEIAPVKTVDLEP
jgi:transglutaminase-like putative cysteine protease